MCCSRINTEILLANLFAKSSDRQYSLSDLQGYLNFLTEHFPVYVASDFSEQAVRECAARYQMLYQVEEQENELVVYPGELTPNLAYFNWVFPEGVVRFLEETTDSFLEQQDFASATSVRG